MGFMLGFASFINYSLYCTLFVIGAYLLWNETVAKESENIFIAIYVVLLGAYNCGLAIQHSPNTAKAMSAAQKIF